MTTTRQFRCEDLFRFNNVNLDPLTETYQMSFYLQYLSTWPDFFQAEAHPSGNLMGYVMGKAEGEGELWHGHVTAVTVSPEYRRMGLATELMKYLEEVSEHVHDCYFVDLCAPRRRHRARDLSHLPRRPRRVTCPRAAASSESRTSRRSPCTRRWAIPCIGACWATTPARRTRSTCARRESARGEIARAGAGEFTPFAHAGAAPRRQQALRYPAHQAHHARRA